MTTQLLSAHLPLLLHLERTGPWSSVSRAHHAGRRRTSPLRSIDVIEIAPVVVDAARLFDA